MKLRNNALTRPPWLVTLVDLIALMLAMFVLIYATQAVDAAKWQRIAKSLASAFMGDGSDRMPQSRGPLMRSERPALDLSYLEMLLRDKLADIGVAAVERRRDGVAIVLPEAAESALFDLANVLASLENTIAVRAAVRHDDWERAIGRAREVANALRAAGYPQPVAALARAAAPDLEIIVRPGAGTE